MCDFSQKKSLFPPPASKKKQHIWAPLGVVSLVGAKVRLYPPHPGVKAGLRYPPPRVRPKEYNPCSKLKVRCKSKVVSIKMFNCYLLKFMQHMSHQYCNIAYWPLRVYFHSQKAGGDAVWARWKKCGKCRKMRSKTSRLRKFANLSWQWSGNGGKLRSEEPPKNCGIKYSHG